MPLIVLGAGLFAWIAGSQAWRSPREVEPPPAVVAPAVEGLAPGAPIEPEAPTLSLPSGGPQRISCADAQSVSAFLQRELAAPAIVPTPSELSESWAALLDPHGFWSAAPDSPLGPELSAAASELLDSFFERSSSCAGAERIARVWQPFQEGLLRAFDAELTAARSRGPRHAEAVYQLGAEPIFEDDPVTRPASELARELGARLGAFLVRYPEEAALVEEARGRFFPTSLDALQEIAILAALRAYVPLLDPHGDFAPLDEEWALYAGDETLDAGSALWGDVTRTPLGARIVADPAPPLQVDDLVLSINDLSLAGASVEQIEQASRSAPPGAGFSLRVLRQGEPGPLSLRVEEQPPPAEAQLVVERIRYGAGERVVLRVLIPDVADGLGAELGAVLAEHTPGTSAVLLDLRGNGGGSLDAAVDALGLFVPGARLFPLIHRGAVIEVLQARKPAQTYAGPVAALVDGDTASAAEMLAGALQAYGRGKLIGARTFGKGCVQEYFDAIVPRGVLRMTTLQFVMPDGRPLQQIGLTPDLLLPLAPALEREASITRQPITFDGPDVRDHATLPGPPWPRDSSAPGPCQDPLVCRAIAKLAGSRAIRPRAATR